MNATRRAVVSVLAATILAGHLQAGLERKGADAILTDPPRCEFAWLGWDYTNITNPLLLTKNTLDRSMIGIMRIPVGGTLPRGKTRISADMTAQQISALLRENLQARPEKIESVTFGHSTIAGVQAVRLRYTQLGSPTRRGEEYGFVRGAHFFHLLFVAAEGRRSPASRKTLSMLYPAFGCFSNVKGLTRRSSQRLTRRESLLLMTSTFHFVATLVIVSRG
jgi:hypothetical protein